MTIYVHLPDGRRVRSTRLLLIVPRDFQFSSFDAADHPRYERALGRISSCLN